jgi:hypothetical protein
VNGSLINRLTITSEFVFAKFRLVKSQCSRVKLSFLLPIKIKPLLSLSNTDATVLSSAPHERPLFRSLLPRQKLRCTSTQPVTAWPSSCPAPLRPPPTSNRRAWRHAPCTRTSSAPSRRPSPSSPPSAPRPSSPRRPSRPRARARPRARSSSLTGCGAPSRRRGRGGAEGGRVGGLNVPVR